MSKQISLITGTYTQSQVANHLKHFGSNGYVFNYLDEFEVVASSPEAMTVSVKAGGSFMEGYYYEEDAASTINIAASHATLNRIDRVVLRLTPLSAPYAQIAVISGADAASPTAPALTQTSVTYELSLCQVYVGAAVVAIYTANITDERDTAYCGAASSLQTASGSLLYNATLPTIFGNDTDFPEALTTGREGIMVVTDGVDKGWVIGSSATENKVHECDISVSPLAWTAKTNITTPRTSSTSYQPRAIYYDGKIYVIGGLVAAAVSNKNEALDPVANTWATLAVIPTPRYNFGIAQDNGLLYCIGGQTTAGAYSQKNEVYDPVGDSWATLSNLPTAPASSLTYAVSLNGYIWILYKDAGGLKWYRYDPGTDSYSQKQEPVDSVRLASMTPTMFYMNMFVFDGFIWLGYGRYLFRYTISTNTWVCVSETFCCESYVNPTDGNTYIRSFVQAYWSGGSFNAIMNFGDRRFFRVSKYQSGYTHSYPCWWTYYIYLGQVSADKILAFRQRTSVDIDMCNISTQTAGEAIYTMSTDKYGIYYNGTIEIPTQVIQIYG